MLPVLLLGRVLTVDVVVPLPTLGRVLLVLLTFGRVLEVPALGRVLPLLLPTLWRVLPELLVEREATPDCLAPEEVEVVVDD
jgi:hypothetical protein